MRKPGLCLYIAMFIDEAKLYVKGGDGGNGAVAFRREKYVPFGGPAGGDGGRGGHVYVVVNPRMNTLAALPRKRHFRAGNGGHGGNFNRTGKNGRDIYIEVPPGTVVRDAETGELLADLVEPGQKVLVARGGRGGRGNARFATSTNQAPRIAEKGEPGQERWIKLELKLIADVGIVGVPNAGKSTLLSVISAARPKIADYPFTTLEPNLGVVIWNNRDMVVADIPGLIAGAHKGAGLGHDFLRHIQRCRVLIHLLNGFSPDPLADFEQINLELELFDERLAAKPQLVALNKIDLPEVRERWPDIRRALEERGQEPMAISAATHEGVDELIRRAFEMLASLPPEREPLEVPVYRPKEQTSPFEIVREGDGFRVRGERIERLAAMTYWEYDEAVARFQRILEATGIYQALLDAGVKPGDTVYIGDRELVWEE